MDDILINGFNLAAIVFGLVEFAKALGAKGKGLLAVSLLIGLVLGFCYFLSVDGVPVTFAEWFSTAVSGLAIGLVASGFYNFVDNRWPSK